MDNNSETKMFKVSIIYILINFFNKGIGIITIPIFTRFLSVAEMGTVTIWTSWLTLLTPITTMSLTTGSMYIAMNEFKDKRDEYQSSILFLSSISSIVCFIIYLILHKYLNMLFTLSTPLIVFLFIYLLFSPAFDIWMLRQRYEYKIKKMALVSLTSTLLSSVITIIFIIILRNSFYNIGNIRIYTTYSVLGVFAIYFYINIFRKGNLYYSKKYWKFATTVSIPLIFHSLAKNILDVSDRSMISIYCGKDAVGIYGTLYSISALGLIIWTAINNAFVPYLYEKLEKNTEKDVYDINYISYFIILVFAVACISLTALAPEIVTLLTTANYFDAVYIIPPITAGIFLTCIYNLFANVILFHKKTIGVMYATIIAAIVNIGLNAIFIPQYGYIAASYTTLSAFIILAISQGITMKHIHKKPLYNIKMITIIASIVIITCTLFTLVYHYNLLRYLIIILLYFIVFIFREKILSNLKQLKSCTTNSKK